MTNEEAIRDMKETAVKSMFTDFWGYFSLRCAEKFIIDRESEGYRLLKLAEGEKLHTMSYDMQRHLEDTCRRLMGLEPKHEGEK